MVGRSVGLSVMLLSKSMTNELLLTKVNLFNFCVIHPILVRPMVRLSRLPAAEGRLKLEVVCGGRLRLTVGKKSGLLLVL